MKSLGTQFCAVPRRYSSRDAGRERILERLRVEAAGRADRHDPRRRALRAPCVLDPCCSGLPMGSPVLAFQIRAVQSNEPARLSPGHGELGAGRIRTANLLRYRGSEAGSSEGRFRLAEASSSRPLPNQTPRFLSSARNSGPPSVREAGCLVRIGPRPTPEVGELGQVLSGHGSSVEIVFDRPYRDSCRNEPASRR